MGPPRELWYTPAGMVRPRWDERGLQGYDYKRMENRWEEFDEDAFVQFRRRQQPGNPFLGVSPLAALGPEVWMEREAKRMSASVLKNLGILGLIVSLKDSQNVEQTDADVKAFRDYLRAEYGGNRRGETMFANFPIDVHGLTASNPDMVHPKVIHDFVQEMVCAIYKIPAAVVQYGIGLEQTTENATLMQYEKQAWETGMMPVGDQVAAQMSRQLLPAFNLDTSNYRLALDYSGVDVLQEKQTEMAERWTSLVSGGIAMRSEAREAFGLPVEEIGQGIPPRHKHPRGARRDVTA